MTELTECDASLREALIKAEAFAQYFLAVYENQPGASNAHQVLWAIRAALARPQPEAKGPVAAGVSLEDACEPWSFSTGEPPDYDSPLIGVFGAGMAYTESLLAKLLDVSSYEGGDGSEDFDCDATMTLVNILAAAGLYDKDECQPILASTTPPAAPKTPDAGVGRWVPSEPTEAMLDAYWNASGESINMRSRVHERARSYYRAMISASLTPTGSAGEDETGVREAWKAVREDLDCIVQCRSGEACEAWNKLAGALDALSGIAPQPPKAETPAGVGEPNESEDAYIARVLAMSPDEVRAEAEAVGVEIPPPRSLPASLRNLRFRLESALANRLEEGDREAIGWLNEGVIALGAALATLTPPADPKPTVPGNDAGMREAATLWDALHEAMICAWNLLDGTQDDASGVDQADWDALSAAMTAMGVLVPASEQPFSPSYAVPYLRALAPQPPKAETPAGVGEPAYRIDLVHLRNHLQSEGATDDADAITAALNDLAALSTAPAARPGDGFVLVSREPTKAMSDAGWAVSEAKDRKWESCTPRQLWSAMIAAAPAADGGRA